MGSSVSLSWSNALSYSAGVVSANLDGLSASFSVEGRKFELALGQQTLESRIALERTGDGGLTATMTCGSANIRREDRWMLGDSAEDIAFHEKFQKVGAATLKGSRKSWQSKVHQNSCYRVVATVAADVEVGVSYHPPSRTLTANALATVSLNVDVEERSGARDRADAMAALQELVAHQAPQSGQCSLQ